MADWQLCDTTGPVRSGLSEGETERLLLYNYYDQYGRPEFAVYGLNPVSSERLDIQVLFNKGAA